MERKNLIKKGVVVAVILLFISVSVIPSTGTTDVKQSAMPTSSGDTLYVGGSGPNNYTKIQDAIDNASSGDTVFVYNGTYVENLHVYKSIDLIGEDRNKTIVDGNMSESSVVYISAGRVNISEFTIQNGGTGIRIYLAYKCTIVNSSILQNGIGVDVFGGSNCTIVNSSIKNNHDFGIYLNGLHDCVIIDNEITNNEEGIYLCYCHDCVFINNKITDNDYFGLHISPNNPGSNYKILGNIISGSSRGILLEWFASKALIEGNIISNNEYGLVIEGCTDNIISGNEFSRNKYFIIISRADIFQSYDNKIVNNNFIRNGIFGAGARDNGFSNLWDGNYWNRPRLLPAWIPLHVIDWHPARKPYDIRV